MAQEITRRETTPSPFDRIVGSLMARDPFFAGLGFGSPAMALALDEGSLALDVSEDAEHVIVRASLPGFRREDVQAEVHDGVLTIAARRTDEQEERTEKYYRKERREGSLSRRVALPTQVDEDHAIAELRDGVLTLKLPKAEKARRRSISIN